MKGNREWLRRERKYSKRVGGGGRLCKDKCEDGVTPEGGRGEGKERNKLYICRGLQTILKFFPHQMQEMPPSGDVLFEDSTVVPLEVPRSRTLSGHATKAKFSAQKMRAEEVSSPPLDPRSRYDSTSSHPGYSKGHSSSKKESSNRLSERELQFFSQ